jgi:hypothetical protein
MLTHRWSFASRRWQLLVPLFGVLLLLTLLATGARASQAASDESTSTAWPAGARVTAGTVAQRWAANVRADARLGAEPAGHCRRLDNRHAVCPVAIVVLARDVIARRPWRCTAKVLVSRAAGHLAGTRTNSDCVPFPEPERVPDPSTVLGTAFALDANGDVACLPGSGRRMTCVMSYATPTGGPCFGAASVPLGRPSGAVALGAPVCRAPRHG